MAIEKLFGAVTVMVTVVVLSDRLGSAKATHRGFGGQAVTAAVLVSGAELPVDCW